MTSAGGRTPSNLGSRWSHPALGVVLGSLLFGTSGTARSYAPDGVSTESIAGIRLILGALPLGIYAVATNRALPGPRPTLWSVVAGMSMIVFQLAFFTSVDRCGVAVGTMLAIGSGPIIAALGETLAGSRPSSVVLGGMVVGLGGLILLVAGQTDAASTRVDGLGVASGVAAGASYALYTVASKVQITNGMSGSWAMAWAFGVAGVLALPMVALQPMGWITSVRGASVGLYLGIATIAAAYLLYAHSLQQLPSSTIVTLTLVEPVTAATLGAVVLHEHLPTTSWFGGAAVCVGLAIVGRYANVRSDP